MTLSCRPAQYYEGHIAFLLAGANNPPLMHRPPKSLEASGRSVGTQGGSTPRHQNCGRYEMKSLRNVVGVVLAFALAAFAVPAAAQQKQYSLQMSPQPTVASGSKVVMTAKFTNTSPSGGANSAFNSLRLDGNSTGYTITQVRSVTRGDGPIGSVSVTPPVGVDGQSAKAIRVEFLSSVGKGQYVTIEFEATVPDTCDIARWNPNATGDVWSGSQIGSGQSFTLQLAASAPTTRTPGILSLAFDATSLPTSFVEDKPFTVSVFQQSSCGVSLAPVTVTLTATGASFTGSSATGTGTISLMGTFNDAGNSVTLTASATGYAPATTGSFTVFASGNLKCPDIATTPAETQFSASPAGVTSIAQTAYAAGFRGLNVVKPDGKDCEPVNYEFTNNILGDGTGTNGEKTDAKGQTVPANGISFVWDQTFQPNAAYSYTATWQPEWFGLGSPNNRKTKFCNGSAPNVCSSSVDAQACLSPALDISSMPGYPSSPAPACISAEVWAVVPATECAALGAAPADQPSCVRFSTTVTDIFDPVFIR